MLEAPFGQNEEEVNVVVDAEIEDKVVEILGANANLGFSVDDMELPYIVIHTKYMRKYFRFDLGLVDNQGKNFSVTFKNNQSLVRIKSNSCSLPLRLHKSWNRICIDLRQIMDHAFGTKYHSCRTVRLYANCRIWKLFFQARDYADDELPEYLRVIE